MGYYSLSVHIAGKDAEEKRAEIYTAAQKRGLSISKFLIECYEIVKAARQKKENGVPTPK